MARTSGGADYEKIASALGLNSVQGSGGSYGLFYNQPTQHVAAYGKGQQYIDPNYSEDYMRYWGGKNEMANQQVGTTQTADTTTTTSTTQTSPYQSWYDYWSQVYGQDYSAWPQPASSQGQGYTSNLPSGLNWTNPQAGGGMYYGGTGQNENPYAWWKNYFSS